MILHQVLIVEVGSLQVFCYQTQDEIDKKVPYGNVYFQDKNYRIIWGPFETIHAATKCYNNMVEDQKKTKKPLGSLIHVDFKSKKRVMYGKI